MPLSPPEQRRLIDRLIREVVRAEAQAVEHPVREAKRLREAPPIHVLRDVAEHAAAMRPRFEVMVLDHGLALHRYGIGRLSTLRHLVVDRVSDPERAFRTALLELRHGLEVVGVLREAAWTQGFFGVIRWCDDWLSARRTLVARASAQLAWFAENDSYEADVVEPPRPAPPPEPTRPGVEDDWRDWQ
jgi:hypothetical protein